MKKLIKIIKSLTIVITILFIGCSSIIFADNTNNDNQESIVPLDAPNKEEPSMLFTFLTSRLTLERAVAYIKEEAGYSCDFCELKNRLSLDDSDGYPDYMRELGFPGKKKQYISSLARDILSRDGLARDFDILDESMEEKETDLDIAKICNLCQLLENLPFKDLYLKLLNQLNTLIETELNLHGKPAEDIEQIISEVKQIFNTMRASEENIEIDLNRILDTLYTEENIAHLPNLLDKLEIVEDAHYAFIDLINGGIDEEIDLNEKDLNEIRVLLHFAYALANYKIFLDDNGDILNQVEQIANNAFQIEEVKEGNENNTMKTIDGLSEIMPYAEKLLQLYYKETARTTKPLI